MDIMELGAIGEIVGGVAVVGTLLFLALQIRDDRKIRVVEHFDRLQENWIATWRRLGDEAPAFLGGMADYENLSHQEQVKFHIMMTDVPSRFWVFKEHADRGLVEVANVSQLQNLVTEFFANPGTRSYWKNESQYWAPQMVAWMDAHIDGAKEARKGDARRMFVVAEIDRGIV